MATFEDASISTVFTLTIDPIRTLLFVDESDLCREYVKLPWVAQEAEILFIDEAVVEVLGVVRVPQYKFYVEGEDVGTLLGTASQSEVIEKKKDVFGSIRTFPNPKKPNLSEDEV